MSILYTVCNMRTTTMSIKRTKLPYTDSDCHGKGFDVLLPAVRHASQRLCHVAQEPHVVKEACVNKLIH